MDDADPNEKPFNPNNDIYLEDQTTWIMAPYVDVSHFQLYQVLGTGSTGLVWQVERRAGR